MVKAVRVNEPKMDKKAVGVQRDCFTRKSCQKLIPGKSSFEGTWDSNRMSKPLFCGKTHKRGNCSTGALFRSTKGNKKMQNIPVSLSGNEKNFRLE